MQCILLYQDGLTGLCEGTMALAPNDTQPPQQPLAQLQYNNYVNMQHYINPLQYYVSMAKQNSTAAQIHYHGVIIEWKLKEHVNFSKVHTSKKEVK